MSATLSNLAGFMALSVLVGTVRTWPFGRHTTLSVPSSDTT